MAARINYASGRDFKELPSKQGKQRVCMSFRAEPGCNWGRENEAVAVLSISPLPVLVEILLNKGCIFILRVFKAASLEETIS